MSDLQTLWRNRNDEQVREALEVLSDYGDEAQAILRAEQSRRGILMPAAVELPLGDVQAVARTHRVLVTLVAIQWMSLVYAVFVNGPQAPAAALVMIGVTFPIRIFSAKLLALVDADSRLLTLASVPLFGLILVFKFPGIAAKWARRHGVDVGLSGPRN
ncbi:MAG: hypothetical protein ABIT71_18315 [Vicinamibacteraceae bacterium]